MWSVRELQGPVVEGREVESWVEQGKQLGKGLSRQRPLLARVAGRITQ